MADLVGFADADGASQDHRRAISGYVFMVDGGGRVVVVEEAGAGHTLDDGSHLRHQLLGTSRYPKMRWF